MAAAATEVFGRGQLTPSEKVSGLFTGLEGRGGRRS